MLPRVDLDHLSSADLKALVIRLMERIAGLEHTVAALREEIARLKGLKGPPSIKPSGMEQASEDAPPKEGRRKRRRRGRGAANLSVHEDRVVKIAVPAGSRFKGYEDFLVQDVIVRAHVIRYRRERWLTPDGKTVIAPLPAGLAGHCGADLRRYVLALYHQGQLTVPRLVEHLASLGLRVSKRQVVRLLTDQAPFVGEARAVLRAGLRTARWMSVDDTGARHKAVNGVCTQIGDDRFTAFATTSSKMAFHKKSGLKIEEMVRSRWVYRKLRNFEPGSRPASPASNGPTAWPAARGAGSTTSRPTSGLRSWPTISRCSSACARADALSHRSTKQQLATPALPHTLFSAKGLCMSS